jgi:hypothetical protein
MTSKDDVLTLAREAGFVSAEYWPDDFKGLASCVERFAELVRADERNKLAAWMMQQGYATGHGDTIEDLLQELEWQVAEREREACAKVCDELFADVLPYSAPDCAAAIRERGQA